MKMSKWFGWIAWSLAIFALPATTSGQTVRRVPQDFPTIQGAINASVNGDTVLVAAGTYTENINFQGKAITVRSASGADLTIIDGAQKGSVVTFSSGEGKASVLMGFTVQNGSAQLEGGGILVSSTSPTITGNKIVNNVGCDGLGIAIGFGSPVIQGNIISNNMRTSCSGGNGGGGILVRGASMAQILGNAIMGNNGGNGIGGGGISLFAAGFPTIRSNIIMGNAVSSPGSGGGISMVNQSDANITQNLITENTAPNGGGGVFYRVPSGALGPTLINNTIADNDGGSQGSGVFANDLNLPSHLTNNIIIARTGQTAVFCSSLNSMTPPLFDRNDVFAPQGTAYGGICTDQTGTNGNISADPLFVAPSSNNYHLQSGSPAIDAGDNSAPNLPPKDIDGDNRIINATGKPGAIVDMGVDEFSTAEVLVLSNSSLTFGGQRIGTSSPARSFTFTNNGAAIANISAVMSAGDFSQTNTCGTSLAAGANCSVSVIFTPTASGVRNGVVAIMTDASESPQAVLLSGTGGPVPPAQVLAVPH